MNRLGMGGRWSYLHAPTGAVFGLSDSVLIGLWTRADVLINLTGSTRLREHHCRVPARLYVETDPVLPQIEMSSGNMSTVEMLAAHSHHFTYGENIGAPDCGVPATPFSYQATRQPVVVDWWGESERTRDGRKSGLYTTIANWEQTEKDIEWNGETLAWSKHRQFLRFLELPEMSNLPFELALSSVSQDTVMLLERCGWNVTDGMEMSRELLPYRDYIRRSRGEFTVAKDQNIRLRSGWFSDRSASYLAAGRPVVTQDTGFGSVLPVGEGLFAFTTMEDILGAFDAIESDYARHSHTAREIAWEYFRAETVLGALLANAVES
jgi:hypothetical protein